MSTTQNPAEQPGQQVEVAVSGSGGEVRLERRRTGWDIALGIIMIIGGVVALTHVVAATAVSVLFLGWVAIFGGLVMVVAALTRWGQDGFWALLIGGFVIGILGLVLLRNPVGAAFALTVIAGFMFILGGIMRIAAAFAIENGRWLLVLSGVLSLALGVLVFTNLVAATLGLLGVLLGVQLLMDGITTVILGRWRIAA